MNRMGFIVAVFITLPPDKPFDFISSPLPMREFLVEVVEYVMGSPEAFIILFPRIPVDRLWIGALAP